MTELRSTFILNKLDSGWLLLQDATGGLTLVSEELPSATREWSSVEDVDLQYLLDEGYVEYAYQTRHGTTHYNITEEGRDELERR
jgi:hypothetical protein